MRKAHAAIWVFALFCAATAAWPQTYPAKSIRIVVGFPPGGGNDIIARMVGAKMQENWSQPVVIDYRPVAESTSIPLRAFFVPRATAKRTSATRARPLAGLGRPRW